MEAEYKYLRLHEMHSHLQYGDKQLMLHHMVLLRGVHNHTYRDALHHDHYGHHYGFNDQHDHLHREILLLIRVREIHGHDHDLHESSEQLAQKLDRKKPRCQV